MGCYIICKELFDFILSRGKAEVENETGLDNVNSRYVYHLAST